MERDVVFNPAPRPRPRTADRHAEFGRLFMGGDRSGRPPRQYCPTATTSASHPRPSCTQGPTISRPSVQPSQHTWHPHTQTRHGSPGSGIPPVPPQPSAPPRHAPLPPTVLNLRNIGNTCYAIATVQVFHKVGLLSSLRPGLTPQEQNLSNLLGTILRSATMQQFDLVNLVMALNMCLPPDNMLSIGRQECAGEFLQLLLKSLNLPSFFSTFQEQNRCPTCNTTHISNFPPTNITPFVLVIPVPQGQEVNLNTLANSVINRPEQVK